MTFYKKYLLYKSKYLLQKGGSNIQKSININFKNTDSSTLPIFNCYPDTSILDVLKFIREQTGKNLTSIEHSLAGKRYSL